MDDTVARLTLLLVAVPPFLLAHCSTVADPHFDTDTFGFRRTWPDRA